MRLSEFADPNEYTPSTAEAVEFFNQILHKLSDHSAEENAPSASRHGQRLLTARRKLFDAL
jgi:hypothetical protein